MAFLKVDKKTQRRSDAEGLATHQVLVLLLAPEHGTNDLRNDLRPTCDLRPATSFLMTRSKRPGRSGVVQVGCLALLLCWKLYIEG